jgi:hypothetical protein
MVARRVRKVGLLAAAMAAVCAAGLGLLAASNQSPGLPAEVPWPVVFGALLITPALIGGLGAVSGRRTLLVGAGLLYVAQSVLSFSGVTLVFLVPALIFLRVAVATPAPAQHSAPTERVRALRWVILTALAVPVALLAVLNLGVFGIVGLVALAALTPALLRRRGASVGWRDALIAGATVGLVLAAMYAAFANTQTVCWNASSTAAGVAYERIPAQEEGPIELDSGIVSSGCSGGQPTIEGAALTAIFLIGAVAIAALAARTARPALAGADGERGLDRSKQGVGGIDLHLAGSEPNRAARRGERVDLLLAVEVHGALAGERAAPETFEVRSADGLLETGPDRIGKP